MNSKTDLDWYCTLPLLHGTMHLSLCTLWTDSSGFHIWRNWVSLDFSNPENNAFINTNISCLWQWILNFQITSMPHLSKGCQPSHMPSIQTGKSHQACLFPTKDLVIINYFFAWLHAVSHSLSQGRKRGWMSQGWTFTSLWNLRRKRLPIAPLNNSKKHTKKIFFATKGSDLGSQFENKRRITVL